MQCTCGFADRGEIRNEFTHGLCSVFDLLFSGDSMWLICLTDSSQKISNIQVPHGDLSEICSGRLKQIIARKPVISGSWEHA